MSEALRLLLVRHGQADDVEGRCIGHTDVPLSESGATAIRQMTGRVVNALSPQSDVRIVSSDLRRAADSARLIAAVIHAPVEYDARLRELGFGEWDGRLWAEIKRSDPRRYDRWMDEWVHLSAPSGETVDDLLRRARDWVDSLPLPSARAETIVAVAHAGWIRAVLTLLLQRPSADMFDMPVGHASLTVVDKRTNGSVLVHPDTIVSGSRS